MKQLLTVLLLLLPSLAPGATYYVAKGGHDTTGNGTAGAPWLTVGKAATVAVAADVVLVGDGDFNESVHETTAGVTYRAVNKWGARIRAFRFGASSITLDGFKVDRHSGVGNTWGAAIRIDATSDNPTITNCWITDQPMVIAHDFSWPAPNTILSPSSDFVAAGFEVGSKIYLGACGLDHPTLGAQYFENHDTSWEIATITPTQLTLTNGSAAWIPDAGTGDWAFIRPGTGNSGLYAIMSVQASGDQTQNPTITNNRIENWACHAMLIDADNMLLQGNYVTKLNGGRWITYTGSNHVMRYNVVRKSPNVLHFTDAELASLIHPPGTGFYDYQAGMFAGSSDANNHQNVLIEYNWFEDLENQMGRIDDESVNAFDVTIQRNVFIGVTEHFSGSRDGMKWRNNSFWKCAFGPGGHPLQLGGDMDDMNTGVEVTGNIFGACGKPGATETLTRGWYSLANWLVAPVANFNFVASEELTGFMAKPGFSEVNGVNGGDPVFYNTTDFLGPDGLPFTSDDGLQVLANSPAAGLGGGALGVRPVFNQQPVAHFRVSSPTGWFEDVGDAYDPAWVAGLPSKRGRPQRPFDTPAKLGDVPRTVTFAADKSISAVNGATTNTAITRYTWDFGDGTAPEVTHSPNVTHTFTNPGDWAVKLTVQNSLNNSHSFSQKYRLGGLAPGTGEVREVPAEYATIAAAMAVAAPGDTVRISPGVYTAAVSTQVNGTSANPIIVEGQGAVTIAGWNQRHDWHVIRNIKFTGRTTQYSAQFLFQKGADHNVLQDCVIDSGYLDNIYGIDFQAGTGAGTDNVVERCTIEHVWGMPMISLAGDRNIVRHCTIQDGWDVDFLRIFGSYNVFQFNRCQRNIVGPVKVGNHPDFVQTFGNNGEWSYGHIIENNVVLDVTNGQLTQLSTTGMSDIRDWTFRNNLFANIALQASCTVPGVKYYNNVFYNCNYYNEGNALNFGRRKHDRIDVVETHPEYATLENPVSTLTQGWYYNVELPEIEIGTNGIEDGKEYKVSLSDPVRVVYNGIERGRNAIFTGVPGQTDFTVINGTSAQVFRYGYVTYRGTNYERDRDFQATAGVNTFTASNVDVKLYRNIISFSHGSEVRNNIFLDCGEVGNNQNGWYAFSTDLVGVAADNNYVGKGGFLPMRVMSPPVAVGGAGNWAAKGWWEPNGINGGNPGLVNPAGYDFRLLADSILRDKGQNVAGVTVDFYGLSRPRGTVTDIGLNEFDDNVAPPPPPVEPEPLLAPTNLTATLTTPNATRLTWTRNSNNETAFQLSRSTDGTSWGTPVTIPAGSTTWLVTGLLETTTYYFQLRAVNAAGSSSWSNQTVTTTLSPPPLRRRWPRSTPAGIFTQ